MLSNDQSCFVDKRLASEFTCVCCMGVLFKPMIDPCGHSFCQSCILTLAQNETVSCPFSRKKFTSDQLKNNLTLESFMGVLGLKCFHHDLGCNWSGVYKDYEQHMYNDCVNKLVNCPNAGCSVKNLDREEYQAHSSKCEFSVSPCEHCQLFITRKDSEFHLKHQCQEVKLPCEFCKTQMSRKFIKLHKQVCIDGLFPCTFFEHGCWTHNNKREFYRKYYQDIGCVTSHLRYTKEKLMSNDSKIKKFLEALIGKNSSALRLIQNDIFWFFVVGPMDDPVARRYGMMASCY
jgi:hypothetical protein